MPHDVALIALIAAGFVFAAVFGYLADRLHLPPLVGYLVAGVIIKYIAFDVATIETGRYRGVLGNPNGLGMFLALFFMLFYMIKDLFPGLFTRQESLAIYLVIFLSVYWTGSRNAILSILIFYSFQRFFGLSPFLGFIIFLTVLLVSEIISTNLAAIIVSLGMGDFFRIKTLAEGSGRYVAWEFAWNQIQNNFFIGKGFAYNEYFMRQHYHELGKLGHQGGIHNSFLTFWMDQGLIGLLIYLRSYVLLFIKAAKRTRFAFPVMFAVSFMAMFESLLVGSLSPYVFLVIMLYSILSN